MPEFRPSSMVYPRTHGETLRVSYRAQTAPGLSPYTRGNPLPDFPSKKLSWSIPVHTGKPCPTPPMVAHSWVYPRTHGETAQQPIYLYIGEGLSPYTRGNPKRSNGDVFFQRSIPVHTGKPTYNNAARTRLRVYPRTHGETQPNNQPKGPARGLSPYTRGNLGFKAFYFVHGGSIPVHTGKPRFLSAQANSCAVYPRTHGETIIDDGSLSSVKGLSPYTRGTPPSNLPGEI